MSKRLLCALNANRLRRFRDWLDRFEGEPRIAWYPSAGWDLRDFLHLSPAYAAHYPGTEADPAVPDIFLHTDYFPWSEDAFPLKEKMYADRHTQIRMRHLEELPPCRLALSSGLVDFPD
jgi:hypothetical protein